MNPTIALSKWERNVFEFMRFAAKRAKPSPPEVELRVAGGWVRDKLLGRETGDVDIAVRHVTGMQFADRLYNHSKFLRSRAQSTEVHIPYVSSPVRIASNVAASKHLETAKLQIDGMDLDFVQLRTEQYTDSRIPQICDATPHQDALRRDFTMNALFYNLHTSKVEDWTNQGLADISARVLRTPLKPEIILREDPLRALRAVRFSCELSCEICKPLQTELKDATIHRMLGEKVSRERIGVEVIRSINANALQGLRLIHDFGLTPALFGFEYRLDRGIGRVERALQILKSSTLLHDHDQRGYQVVVFASLLWDKSLVRKTLQKSLRLGSKLQEGVENSITLGKRLGRLFKEWKEVTNAGKNDDEIWLDMAETYLKGGASLWGPIFVCAALEAEYSSLAEVLAEQRIVDSIFDIMPCFDGWAVQKELKMTAGPEVGRAKSALNRLQLLNFRRSGEIEVDSWLKSHFLEVLKQKKADGLL